MRYHLTLFALLLCVSLSAQTENRTLKFESENGYWQINAGYFLPVTTKFPFIRYTTDTLGLPPRRFGISPSREIEVDGVNYSYYSRPAQLARATDPSNWWAFKLGIRRTFSYGLSLRIEVFRTNANYTSIPQNLDGLLGNNDGFQATQDTLSATGQQIGLDYTFMRNKRFQIQLGLSARFSTVKQSFSQPLFTVPDLGYEEPIGIPTQFLSRRVRDNDMAIQVDVLYRITPSFSVGLEFWRQLDRLNQLSGSFIGLDAKYWIPAGNLF